MVSQAELAERFFNFETDLPQASNMEVRQLEGATAILVGGEEWIHAIREPMDNIAVFRRYPRYSSHATITRGWASSQKRKVVTVAMAHEFVNERNELIRQPPPRLSQDGINTARDYIPSGTEDNPAASAAL